MKLKQKALLLLSGLIAGLVFGELALRFAAISYPVFEAYDQYRARALKPGKEGWYHGEGGAYLKINSLGYRDLEHTKEKPRRVFRIAVLGDSFTEARQVDITETFWKRLETRFHDGRELGGRKVEVLNFGIGGYGTTQELLTLKLHVFDFHPDLVILAFCPGNDLADNSKQLSTKINRGFSPFYVLRNGTLVLDNSFRDLSLAYLRRRFLLTAIHYSRILEVINQARRIAVARQFQRQPGRSYEIGIFDEEFLEPKDKAWTDAWAVTEAILADMNKEVERAGAQFVLVTLTTPIQVDPDVAKRAAFQRALSVSDLFYTERRLRRLGNTLGFPVITLAEQLQEVASQSGVYFHGFRNTGLGTGHWNARGHEIAADILAKELPHAIETHRRKQ